jgi:maleate isomerase
MSIRPAEYAAKGLLGIGTPQANPTVEAEFCALRPAGVGLVTARMVCLEPDPERRLRSYLDDLEHTLARYDTLRLDAFGFACTGSTYLRGYDAERELVTRLEDRFGYPVITATAAIEARLKSLDASAIALITPYPDWLFKTGIDYWTARGFRMPVIGHARLPGADLHQIYELGSQQALDVLRSLDLDGVDAVLFSGTGMPSLRAILAAQPETGLPVISSNLALAGCLFDRIGLDGNAVTAPESWAPRVPSL